VQLTMLHCHGQEFGIDTWPPMMRGVNGGRVPQRMLRPVRHAVTAVD